MGGRCELDERKMSSTPPSVPSLPPFPQLPSLLFPPRSPRSSRAYLSSVELTIISGEMDIEILCLPLRTVQTTSAPSAERTTPPPLIKIAASRRRISEGSTLVERMKIRREARIPMEKTVWGQRGGEEEGRAHRFRERTVEASLTTTSINRKGN